MWQDKSMGLGGVKLHCNIERCDSTPCAEPISICRVISSVGESDAGASRKRAESNAGRWPAARPLLILLRIKVLTCRNFVASWKVSKAFELWRSMASHLPHSLEPSESVTRASVTPSAQRETHSTSQLSRGTKLTQHTPAITTADSYTHIEDGAL